MVLEESSKTRAASSRTESSSRRRELHLTPEQCRGARAMLNMSARELARRSKIGVGTLGNFETGRCKPIPSTIAAIKRTLEDAGIVFMNSGGDPGLILRGRTGF
jgi:DNA-binding transcriptional regulator YiaG